MIAVGYAITPPIEPMLAKLVDAIPDSSGFLFEPKWDGFRSIVFRSKDDVYIQSRDLKVTRRISSAACLTSQA